MPKVTEWIPSDIPPSESGGFQIMKEKELNKTYWAVYNAALRHWGAICETQQKAIIMQFADPTHGEVFFWRGRV